VVRGETLIGLALGFHSNGVDGTGARGGVRGTHLGLLQAGFEFAQGLWLTGGTGRHQRGRLCQVAGRKGGAGT